MSSSVTAEAPPFSSLPRPPSREEVETLSRTLDDGFKAGRRSAGSLRRRLIKAKLDAMRLAPVPADARKALSRAREAVRLAHDAARPGEDGGEDATDAAALAAEARSVAAEARAMARTVIAHARKAVRPGSREDSLMARLQAGLAGEPSDAAAVDISV